ncbi:unnamed protein product [Diamesa tonsa]
MNFLLFFVAVFYCFYAPFTKVEESFNMQAMHDILYHRFNLTAYDHNEFPGVVPRTFLGPIAVAVPIYPVIALLNALQIDKFWSQYLVRLTLAAFVCYSWNKLKEKLQLMLGVQCGVWFTLISITQFHFMFYMSRPLPNIFALPLGLLNILSIHILSSLLMTYLLLVLLSVNSWLRREKAKFLIFAGAAIIIFRSELVIFLGLLLLYDLFFKRMSIIELLKIGIPTGIGIVALTVAVDSLFWQRLLWPEAEVLWFNTIMNKSSEWGTSPFLWYFYSALPRAMGFSLLFVPYGLYVEPRIRAITIPAILFVFIYSMLPHKELRFIIYVFPMLNIATAVACHRIWINRAKSMFHAILSVVAGGHLFGNFILTVFLLTVSSTNYPGGVAMSRLHRIANGETNITIHIDNLTAQSGVSRFTQINANWTYSKDETLKAGDEDLHRFDYLLAEVKNKYSPEMRYLQQTHEKLEVVECFSNIGIHYTSLLPVKIRTKPCIMIMRRKPNAVLLKSIIYEGSADEMDSEVNEVESMEVSPSIEEEEEEEVEVITVKTLMRKKLRRTTTNPKSKIKEIIEAEKLEAELEAERIKEFLKQEEEAQIEEEEPEIEVEDEPDVEDEPEVEIEDEEESDEIPTDDESEESSAEQESDEVNEDTDDLLITKEGSGVKLNIKKIISQERTKYLKDELSTKSTIDLSSFCNLDEMDTKDCLKKILEEYNE